MTIAAPYPFTLIAIALTLSSVTVVSVSTAVGALIQDPFLMVLFAGAGALLDLFKYLAWPLAAFLLLAGRRAIATALMTCALLLACVSGWATYDRFMTAILGNHGEALAIRQRIVDIEAARAQDIERLDALNGDERATQAQLSALRDRIVVSRSLDMERITLRRLDDQRVQLQRRLDDSSRELAELRAKPTRAAALPLELATLLCAGFALALELVPALLLTAVRGVAGQKQPENAPETQPETDEAQSATAASGENALLQTLLRSVAQAKPGAPVVLREFARAERIGNARATQAFRAAVELGALQRTDGGGYMAARTNRKEVA